MKHQLATYTPVEARAMEDALIQGLRGTAKPAMPKMTKPENKGGTPARELAHQNRMAILEFIRENGPSMRRDIREEFQRLTESGISNYLGWLHGQKLIERMKENRLKWQATQDAQKMAAE